jgi:competence protein ComEA
MWEQLPKEIKALAVVFIVALLFGTGVLTSQLLEAKNRENALLELPSATLGIQGEEELLLAPETIEEEKDVVVHVSGAVVSPGVYSLPHGSRVNDAILLAVPLDEADLDALNLAALISDGQKIAVPKIGEVLSDISLQTTEGVSVTGRGKVNLNTASSAELETLPGIGPATAQKIIDYRTQHGAFNSVEDLNNVSGIGPKKFEDIKDLVSVR